ncbi:hypothetical protein U8P73_36220 (plasmid) [Rhizobium beringeri]|uniref:hypothetical protein n=1 Tax=Rhizobium beringeri TaxID=3019934 RepID=UPI002DDDAA11|nr:hypothetical protein [Rhizobium beringeri]WSG93597.1 hypothetical protein U8P73_36220 [Rhizobium beringeri]
MNGPVNIYEIETLPDGHTTLQVISIRDTLQGEQYFVRLADGADDYEDTPFEDYPQAYAHYRNTLRTLGINVAYAAPQIEFSFAEDDKKTKTWVDVFYDFHSQLSYCRAGTEQATAVRDKFMADPEFKEFAAEILAETGEKADWIHATIRTTCRRVLAKEKMETKQRIEEQLGALSTFGAF